MRSFMICAHQIFSGDQVKEDGMGGVCSTYGIKHACNVLVVNMGKNPHGINTRR